MRAGSAALKQVFSAFFGAAAGGALLRPACERPPCQGVIELRGGGGGGGGGGPFTVSCSACMRAISVPREVTQVDLSQSRCASPACCAPAAAAPAAPPFLVRLSFARGCLPPAHAAAFAGQPPPEVCLFCSRDVRDAFEFLVRDHHKRTHKCNA